MNSLPLVLLLSTLASACSTLGPAPDIYIVEGEIAAKKNVGKILVLPTLGTGTSHPDSDINKALPAAAFQRYGERIILPKGLAVTAETLGMPSRLVPTLPVSWLLRYRDWLDDYQKEKANDHRQAIEPPRFNKRIPKTDQQVMGLAKRLKRRSKALVPVTKAIKAANMDALRKSSKRAQRALVLVESMNRHIFNRLGIDYVLLSNLEGNEDQFNEDKPITLQVAMINTETGRFRFFAESMGQKTDLPTDYVGLCSIMAVKMFEALSEVDDIR